MNKIDKVFEQNDLSFSFNIAKTENEGEDADPVLINKGNLSFLSVCDGMGGAGSTIYEVDGLQKSGAYISSRLVNKEAENYFSNLITNENLFNESNLEELKSKFLNLLTGKLKEIKKDGGSNLRSKLLKDLPTTFSSLFIKEGEVTTEIFSIWAGDSRNYLFSRNQGLQQISIDDLKQKHDPFENLTKDSPLDNVVSADGDFNLRYSKIEIDFPCILFTATDGCYGYFNTPMQFEYAILQALQSSNNVEEWKNNLIGKIESVAGDDFSLSLIAIGYENFSKIKTDFSERIQTVYAFYINDLDKQDFLLGNLQIDKTGLEKQIKIVEQKRSETQKNAWLDYKNDYLKHIPTKP